MYWILAIQLYIEIARRDEETLRSELPSTEPLIIGYLSVTWEIQASLISPTYPFLFRFEEKQENEKGAAAPNVGIMTEKVF